MKTLGVFERVLWGAVEENSGDFSLYRIVVVRVKWLC